MPEREALVTHVEAIRTRSGATRYVLHDDEGNEYTTFREAIAREAVAAEGRRARIEFHEQERNGYTNVYLDDVEPLDEPEKPAEATGADEVAWNTAVEATPWLLGSSEPERAVDPEALYETLKPFKDLVASDIEHGDATDDES
jgi:hypothetical protein